MTLVGCNSFILQNYFAGLMFFSVFNHISECNYYANHCNYVSRGWCLSVWRGAQKVTWDIPAL